MFKVTSSKLQVTTYKVQAANSKLQMKIDDLGSGVGELVVWGLGSKLDVFRVLVGALAPTCTSSIYIYIYIYISATASAAWRFRMPL